MTAVAIVPYGQSVRKGLGHIPLDNLLWPLGRPERLSEGSVADLARDDHLITFPRNALWLRPLPRCRTSLLIVEPRTVHGRHMRAARAMGWRFHRILTRDDATFLACRNARFFPFALSSLTEGTIDTTKTRRMSLIASAKRDLEGHQLRHAVIDALPPGADVAVMGRGYLPFDAKEEGLAPFRYSVVIENTRERGYLSEKLIDALMCRTVPIYWGAPDVGDYFDPDGMILCQSKAEILAAIDAADEAGYVARQEAIASNDAAARHLADLYGRAARLILEEDN